ncbi:MAG: hypothetical protein QXQ94_11310 [Candidatus Bathyarchaeia archaeon]
MGIFKARFTVSIVAYLAFFLILIIQTVTVIGSPGNAEVTRTRNLQYFEMTPPIHPPGNALVSRTQNLQYFELVPPVHPPGNAFVTRTQNLQYFELVPPIHPPGDALVTRTKNLQYFEMTPLIYQYRINVTKLQTTDQNGKPCSSFMRGEIVQFDITVENIAAHEGMSLTNGLLAVTVLNPRQNVMFLSYTYINLPKGASLKFTFGYGIPVSATTGTYTVKVMVLTDWPSRGGVGITSKSSNFNVG